MIPASLGWALGTIAAVVWAWHQLLHVLLLRAFAAERRSWLVERQGLCDRIQALPPSVVIEERPPTRPFALEEREPKEEEAEERPLDMPAPGDGSRERFLQGSTRWLGEQ